MIYKTVSLIKNFCLKVFPLIMTSVIIIGCENNPNDVGITFISPDDTLSTRVLDSIPITNNNYKYYINTSNSPAIFVGNFQSYTSKSMLKFTNINPDLDSSVIVSAQLTLKYNDYFFQNETGLTSFNIYQMTSDFNYATVTYDSVSPADYGNISQGTYTGSPVDSQQINITLNNQLAKDWFEYAADNNYAVKNYGIILLPNSSSNTIKGFFSFNNITDVIPFATIIYTKNGTLDTVTLNTTQYVTLSDAPASIIPADRFVLQSGIAYRNILNFDLSKLPDNVIINNVVLTFTLDSKNSFISPNTDKRVVIGQVTDSVTKDDSLFTDVFQSDSITYSLSSTSLNAMFQRWNSNVLTNLGISMKNYFETQNLDDFVFYSPNATEVLYRPRVRITYTLRD